MFEQYEESEIFRTNVLPEGGSLEDMFDESDEIVWSG